MQSSKKTISAIAENVNTPTTKELAIVQTRAASDIARSLGFANREGYKYNCPHDYNLLPEKPAYTVAIDWLQMAVVLQVGINEIDGSDFTRGGWRYVCRPVGTQHYQFCYDIYKGQDVYFVLEAHPRNKAKSDDVQALIKFENWVLYSDWKGIWEDFKSLNIQEVKRISRLDIAIDGLNNIKSLLDDWMVKKTDAYGVKLIGKSKVRPGDVSRITRTPEWYRVGTPKGHKQIAVYNKSKDIERTSKTHIKAYWEANGLTTLEANYRFEMRLKSDYLKQLGAIGCPPYTPDELLNELTRDWFKVDIVRKACESFFEWVYMDDKNISRCNRVNLLPLPNCELERTQTVYNGTAYKAKMQVHNTFYQVAKEIVGIEEGLAIITTQLGVYDLHQWYATRMLDFSKKYNVDEYEKLAALYACSIPVTAPSDKQVRRYLAEIFGAKNTKQRKLIVTEIHENYTRIRTIDRHTQK